MSFLQHPRARFAAWIRGGFQSLVFLALAGAAHAQLENVEAEHTLLGAYAIRPLAFDAATADLFTLNVGLSTVVHFRAQDLVTGVPFEAFQVPDQPVSIAIWNQALDAGGVARRLVVVCRGDHAAVLLDSTNGEILNLLRLDHEPGDLLVDQSRNRAFVSCQGSRTVVEIDLASFTRASTTSLATLQEPLRMCLDSQGRVLVAPLCSGNNSSVVNGQPDFSVIGDASATITPLPDEDLIRIDPSATPPTITTVSTGAGSVLFGHALNPSTGAHWQLDVESLNKDPLRQSEPLLNGSFALNRLTITNLANGTHQFVDLDRLNLIGNNPDPAKTVALPIDVQFDAAGRGYILGLATDNVTILSSAGAFLNEIDLPAGSGPRAALVAPVTGPAFDRFVLVYLANTNKVSTFLFNPGATSPASTSTLDLGFDPAPADVREGRKLFFDASFSRDNRLTCAHCHVEGRSDMLAWNLSGLPKDDKGPLVTQTLFGIRRTPPFHWRGERKTLEDFNGAFTGLLGGPSELNPTQMALFKAFVFALTPAANPHQDKSRQLVGNAVAGMNFFLNTPSVGPLRCVDCHALPAGTGSDIINTGVFTHIPQQNHFDVPSFIETWRKQSIPVSTVLGPRARLGFGLVHDGRRADILAFMQSTFPGFPNDHANLAALVLQWDQGLAPAVHRSARLDFSLADEPEVTFLIAQATARNCDLAAIALSHLNGQITRRNFAFDPATQLFVSESPADPAMPYSVLRLLAVSGLGHLTFVGLPPGNARMWIDWDRDGVTNQLEPLLAGSVGGEEFQPDSDGDLDPDGHEAFNNGNPRNNTIKANDSNQPNFVRNPSVVWASTRAARLVFETDEPTSATVVATLNPSVSSSAVDAGFSRIHNVVLHGLNPNPAIGPAFTYSVLVTVGDPSGNQRTFTLNLTPGVQRTSFPHTETQVTNVTWLTVPSRNGTTVSGQVQFTVADKDTVTALAPAPPPQPQMVVARLLRIPQVGGAHDLKNAVVLTPTTTGGGGPVATSFSYPSGGGNVQYGLIPGELAGAFLLTPSTSVSGGTTAVSFTASGVAAGDLLVVAVMAVLPVDPAVFNPATPVTLAAPFALFSFPDTVASAREISQVLP